MDEDIPSALGDISVITSNSSLDEIQNLDLAEPNLENEEQISLSISLRW